MSNTIAPTETFPQGYYKLVTVTDYQPDGITVDTSEPITATSSNPAVATAAIDPTFPRVVRVTGVAVGSTNIALAAPGVLSDGIVILPVSITAPPNLSRVEIVAVAGPFRV